MSLPKNSFFPDADAQTEGVVKIVKNRLNRDFSNKKQLIEKTLKRILNQKNESRLIVKAMNYSVLNGGKRVRPLVALLAYEALTNEVDDNILYAACSIEFIHSASLILDDLPCMDHSIYRRGKKSAHAVFGESNAILASAALLTLSFELLSKIKSKSLNKVICSTTNAIGLRGMILGQYLDLANGYKSNKELYKLNNLKTGILFKLAAETASILAGAKSKKSIALAKYAEHFGKAYQIRDDVLDIIGNPRRLGKPVKQDVKNGRKTYAIMNGKDNAISLVNNELSTACSYMAGFGEAGLKLKEYAGSFKIQTSDNDEG